MPAGKIKNKSYQLKDVYALCIGIDKYKSSPLNGCVRDVKEFRDAISTSKDKTKLLLDEDATRKNILKHISNYIDIVKKDDLFIFTVSAHGSIVNEDLAIMPYDYEEDNMLGTALSTMYIITALARIADKGGKVLIILDICHSGALNFNLSKYSGALKGSGISSIYACAPNEKAFELPFENGAQGVFTKYLIDGLRGKSDLDNSGVITLRNLYDYVYDNVCLKVKRQHPSLIGTLKGETVLKVL